MNPSVWGALVGSGAGLGVVIVVSRLLTLRRPALAERVLPYVRDLPQVTSTEDVVHPPSARASSLVGPLLGPLVGPFLESAATWLERLLGGSTSIRRKLERANLDVSVHGFRVEQVLWGFAALGLTSAVAVAVSVRSPGRTLPLVLVCAFSFVIGVLLRENRLTAQVTERERRIVAEFPAVAELLALSVGAGEGPVSALDRVVSRSHGELSVELGGVLADIRTGTPVAMALDGLARRSGLPVLARFAEGMAVAVERGTPLSAVLHAQADDVREAGRRGLIESGARKEVAMMVPVVFLVLPVTVVFAFWPGVVGLHLVTP